MEWKITGGISSATGNVLQEISAPGRESVKSVIMITIANFDRTIFLMYYSSVGQN